LAIESDGVLSLWFSTLEIADIDARPTGASRAIQQLLVWNSTSSSSPMLPGVDELDLCSEIRALPGYNRTPILFLTSANTVDGRAQALLAGGSDSL
jgi:CheY-like chemotaxis protein